MSCKISHPWTRKIQCWQNCGKLSNKRPRNSCSNVRKKIKKFFSQFFSNCSSGLEKGRFYSRSGNCFPHNPDLTGRWRNIFRKIFFLKMFLWTNWLQFWPTYRKKLSKKPTLFSLKSEYEKHLKNSIGLKMILWKRRKLFSQPCSKAFRRRPKQFAQSPRRINITRIFQKSIPKKLQFTLKTCISNFKQSCWNVVAKKSARLSLGSER